MGHSKTEKQQEKNRIEAAKKYDKAVHFGFLDGDAKQEIIMLDEVTTLNPGAYWAYVTKSVLFNEIGNQEAARSAIMEAYRINSNSPHVQYTKWKMEHPDASKSETVTAMKQVLELPVVTLRDHITHARAYKLMGNNDLAIATYRGTLDIKEHARNLEIWSNLADLLYNTKDFVEAAKANEMTVKIDKTFVVGWANWGNALAKLGQHKKAEEKLRKAIDLDSQNTNLLNSLAISLDKQGKFKDAIKAHQKQLSLSQTDEEKAEAHYGLSASIKKLANSDLKQKKAAYDKALNDALKESDEALTLEPDNILYLAGKADVLVALKLTAHALPIILKADSLLKNMDADEKAELSDVIGFLEAVTGQKDKLVSELGIDTNALQEMRSHFDSPPNDSGTDGHDDHKLSGDDSFSSKSSEEGGPFV